MNPFRWVGGLRGELARFDRAPWGLVLSQLITSAGFSIALPFLSLYLHRDRGLAMSAIPAMVADSAGVG